MTLFGIYCYLILVQIANRIGPGRPSCCRRVPSACYAVRCPRGGETTANERQLSYTVHVGTSPRQQRAKREEKADAFNIIAPERGQRPFSLTCTTNQHPPPCETKRRKHTKKFLICCCRTSSMTTSTVVCKSNRHNNNSSSSHGENLSVAKTMASTTAYGWRVKLYRLKVDGSWDDCGTGRICCRYTPPGEVAEDEANTDHGRLSAVELVYKKLNNPVLCMHAEVDEGVLLQTRILLRESYQRQGDNIITWREPSGSSGSSGPVENEGDDGGYFQPKVLPESPGGGRVDLALSFQDNAGCLDIWNQISSVQQQALGYISQALLQQHQGKHPDKRYTTQIHNGYHSSSSHMKNSRMNVYPTASTSDSSSDTADPSITFSTVASTRQGRLLDPREKQMHTSHDEGTKPVATPSTTTSRSTTSLFQSPNSSLQLPTQQLQQQQQQQCTTHSSSFCFPNPPQPQNLEEIMDIIHAAMNNCQPAAPTPFLSSSNAQLQNYLLLHHHQHHQEGTAGAAIASMTTISNPAPSKDDISRALMNDDFLYFRKLLKVFPLSQRQQQQQQSNGDKKIISTLCSLASIIKMILYLNLEPLLEYIVDSPIIFLQVLQTMEYDPELRTLPAHHIHFLMNEMKFKTVIWIDDSAFENAVHRCWRITYLKDTVLRPTMVEDGTISTLVNLLQRTHVDIVRFVGTTVASHNIAADQTLREVTSTQTNTNRYDDCYLAQIIRLLGTEIFSIAQNRTDNVDSSLHMSLELATYGKEEMQDTAAVVPPSTDPNKAIEKLDVSVSQNNNESGSTSSTTVGLLSGDNRPIDVPSRSEPSVNAGNRVDTVGSASLSSSPWKQHLLPQDPSLHSRKIRRKGCLQFLRELFIMVRTSLQHNEKSDFYVGICLMDVTVNIITSQSSQSAQQEAKVVNLLQLLGLVLSDINSSTVEEKSAALEILFAIACFDASLIRKHVMDETCQRPARPCGNTMVQIPSSENDLLLSLCTTMATANDIGLLLQTLELLRVLLDTDLHHHPIVQDGEHHSEYYHDQQHDSGAHFYEEIHDEVDDEIVANALGTTTKQHNANFLSSPNCKTVHAGGADIEASKSDKICKEAITALRNGDVHTGNISFVSLSSTKNPFLGLFYDYYIYWLSAPFQFPIFMSMEKGIADSHYVPIQTDTEGRRKHDESGSKPVLCLVPKCAVRANFILEILCFCVRVHGYRMKSFVLRSRILSNVLQLLVAGYGQSGDECLKLAALRLLRAIISAKDEFYSRHIVKHDHFMPVFELLLTRNPIRDNLVSSSIVEIFDYIKNENLKTLLEYIVTRFVCNAEWKSNLSPNSPIPMSPETRKDSSIGSEHLPNVSLEKLSEQHLHIFKVMRQKYEENQTKTTVPVSTTLCHTLRLNDKDSRASSLDKNYDTSCIAGEDNQAGNHFCEGSTCEGSAVQYLIMKSGNDSSILLGKSVLSSTKALEDQRKFREIDDEESYFNDDGDDVDQDILQNSFAKQELILPNGHSQYRSGDIIATPKADDIRAESFRSNSTGVHGVGIPVHDSKSSSTTLAPSWMPVQYGDSSSDEDDELESSCSSADDTDSSVSSIITYASSTSDVGKEDMDDWRGTKRIRVHYGSNNFDDEDSCSNSAPGIKAAAGPLESIPSSESKP